MTITRMLVLGFLSLFCASAEASEAELMETTTTEVVEAEPPAADAAAASPEVARAVITNAIVDREPVDEVSIIRNDQPIIYFFTDLRNLEGVTVTHRWELDGKQMASVPFEVGSPRWRVWSSKTLQPEWLGNWVVSVVGSGGEVLESASFQYTAVASQDTADQQAPSETKGETAPPAGPE